MAIAYENNVTISELIYPSTVPVFDSMVEPRQVETADDIDIAVKYLISSAIFTIIAKTRLPNSELFLRHDLTLRKEITHDGYVIRSNYVDEESFGATLEEAYFDFLTSIRDRYNSLRQRETRLSSRDKAVLENIRSLRT